MGSGVACGQKVEFQHHFLLFAVGLVDLAQADDLAERFHVKAESLGFGVDFLDLLGDLFLFFFETLWRSFSLVVSVRCVAAASSMKMVLESIWRGAGRAS
jgi:hypothetical protein